MMNNENERLKIAFLTADKPQDRSAWSGTSYYIAQALQRHCGDVYYVGPIQSNEKRLGKILQKASLLLLKKNFAFDRCFFVARKHAKIVAKKLAGKSFDVIIAPIGATEVAFLETDIPIMIVKDATFALIHNYNPLFSNLLSRSAYEANTIEDLAYKKASVLLYSSEWAAQSAIEDYHVARGKVYAVPFGANFEETPPREIALGKQRSDRCRLLFVGRGWERKGGDIAFEAMVKLEEMGVPVELTVCGCTPPKEFAHEKMTVIPFLDKSDERQRKELEMLYSTSDFLLLPTRYDCTPMVFCEASAFGLPVITTDTGGVSGVVKQGENGFMLPYNARGAAYAEVIAKIYADEQWYTELVRASRAAFEERLNWDAWGATVKKIIVARATAMIAPTMTRWDPSRIIEG